MTPTLVAILALTAPAPRTYHHVYHRYYRHVGYRHVGWRGRGRTTARLKVVPVKPVAKLAAKPAIKPVVAKKIEDVWSDLKNRPNAVVPAYETGTLGPNEGNVAVPSGNGSPSVAESVGTGVPTDLAKALPSSGVVVTGVMPKIPVAPEATLCSVDVADMEPTKVLRLLSRQTGVNLLFLGTSDAKVTLRLSDVPLLDVIKHIAAITGTSYLKVRDIYVVGSAERLTAAYPDEWKAAKVEPTPAPPQTVETVMESYRTSFVSATGLANSLTSLFKDVQIAAGPAPTSPSVASIDGSQATGSAAQTIAQQDAASSARTVLFYGPRPSVERAMAFARRLDSPRAQVSVAVTVHDVSNDALKDLGISWDFGSFSINEKPSGFNVGKITRTGLSASAAITALESRDAAKLLAAPSLSMLDGERGFVLIGNRINFPVLTGYTQNNAPIFDIKEERVGIYLQVAAVVGSDGSVTLSLYPQVSTVTGYLQVNGASYPQISTREAQTTVRIASGESIVLGGLIRDEDVSLLEKVPLLGNIPFLGELFQHRKVTHNSGQVILTVTPIVTLPDAPSGAAGK